MDITIPSWINLDSVQDILRRCEADNSIVVLDIFSKPATNKGDNYSSDIIRVHVDFTRKQGARDVTEKKPLIFKLAPVDTARKDMVATFGIFAKEISMLTQTLPKMNAMFAMEHRLSPTVLHVQKDDPSFLVIEDLAPLGFRMANRQSGLDLEHSIMAIRNIARFHASSAVLCEKEPDQKELYDKALIHEDLPKNFTNFFQLGTHALADQIETWPELGKTYAEKIRIIADRMFDMALKAVKRKDGEFNVITHGDCWVNNMLFRYNDEGKPIEHIFIDFQISAYTSTAIDLHYFLNTSPCQEVYEESKQLLLDEYLRTLHKILGELGYKGEMLAMSDLEKQLDDRAAYILITAFTILPIVLMDKSNVMPIHEILELDSKEHPAYKSEVYRRVITKRILHFEEIGLLDRFL